MAVATAGGLHHVSGLRAAQLALSMLADPIKCIEGAYRRYGSAIAIDTMLRPPDRRTRAVLLVGPQYNRHVFTNEDAFRPLGLFAAPAPKGSAHANLQRGFLTTHGAEHDTVAKAAAPHLARRRVESYFDAIRTIALDEISQWPTDVTVDLYSLVKKFGHHVSLQLVFGEQDESRRSDFARLLADYHTANWQPFAYLFPVNVYGSPYRDVLQKAQKLQDFIAAWVVERRRMPAAPDMLASFAHMKDGDGNLLSVEKVAGHLSFLGFAAYETMSSALTWSLLLLALHPQTAMNLLDELSAAPPIEEIDYPALSALPLLDAVIKETLRLVPPTPGLPFKAMETTDVEGITVRKGTQVVLSPHLTHRMPEIFSEPHRFLPQRWFSINPSPFEYFPFSGGRRFCPGYWLAVEWLKIGLATVLPRYRVAIQSDAAIDRVFRGITMPKHRIPIELVRQDRAPPATHYRGSLFDLVAVQ